jgi:hypothetical protein
MLMAGLNACLILLLRWMILVGTETVSIDTSFIPIDDVADARFRTWGAAAHRVTDRRCRSLASVQLVSIALKGVILIVRSGILGRQLRSSARYKTT